MAGVFVLPLGSNVSALNVLLLNIHKLDAHLG